MITITPTPAHESSAVSYWIDASDGTPLVDIRRTGDPAADLHLAFVVAHAILALSQPCTYPAADVTFAKNRLLEALGQPTLAGDVAKIATAKEIT